jgi:hypothetical protein
MRITAMLMAILMAIFAFGCTEEGDSPVPADGNGENGQTDNGSEETVEIGDFDYTPPQVGQWIAYGVEGEEGEFRLSVVGEELGSFWYQIEVDGEAVAQVLLDAEILSSLISLSSGYMDDFAADPVAFVESYMPQDGDFMSNQEHVDNMILFLRSIKKIKIADGSQLMMLDMTGVADMVQQMIEANPDLLDSPDMDFNLGEDEEFQEFLAELENATFSIEAVTIDGLECNRFTATHSEEGSIEIVLSDQLPILPLMEARVNPNDPAEEGGYVMVTGFGFEGAADMMPGEADQVIPVSMFLQGMLSEFETQ